MSAQPLTQEARAQGTLRRWIGILSAYVTTQTLTQLLGIAAGLLLINVLPVAEFALYTLALSVVTFFTFASDLGSTSSLVYFFHRANRLGEELQPYVDAVLSLRRTAFLLGGLTVAIGFPWMATAKGFGLAESLLVTCGIVLGVWFQISASLRILVLRLADRYGQSYRAEVAGGGVRLLLVLALVASRLLWAWLAVLASGLASAAVALLARPEREPDREEDLRPYRRRVLRYLLPSLPSALYFSIQGPLTIWLAATFGDTRNIAEVGALGRLGLIVGILSNLTGVVFLPRLARITEEAVYRRRYLQFGSLLLSAALGLVLLAAVFPEVFLFILGKRYASLHQELLLVMAGTGLTLLGGYAVSVNLARSWNRWEGLAVLVLMGAQAFLVSVLPLATTSGVLLFQLFTALVGLFLQLLITLGGFLRPRWVQWMT